MQRVSAGGGDDLSRLHDKEVGGACFSHVVVPVEKQGGTWDAFFWVEDATALHAEFAAKGADVVYRPLVQEAYQMLEFAVRDRDGHVLGFGQASGQRAKSR